MTVKTLNLDGYDIEELEEDYELVIEEMDKGYLIECNAGVIKTTDMLDLYIEWHDAADLFYKFSDTTKDWEDMTTAAQKHYSYLQKNMEEAEDKLFG